MGGNVANAAIHIRCNDKYKGIALGEGLVSGSIGLGGNEITYIEDRLLTNLRLFWRSPSERWQLEGYVENVFAEDYIDNMYALSGMDYAYGNMGMPRWYGVKVGYSF